MKLERKHKSDGKKLCIVRSYPAPPLLSVLKMFFSEKLDQTDTHTQTERQTQTDRQTRLAATACQLSGPEK